MLAYRPVRGLTDLAGSAAKAAASGERLAEVLDEAPAVREPSAVALGDQRPCAGPGVVEVST